MNEHLRAPVPAATTTQAAEGLPRRRWTIAELEQIEKAGIFHPEERFELIGGEVVPMSPKGRRHEVLREELATVMSDRRTPDIRVVSEPQLNLSEDTYTLPDIVVRPAAVLMPDVRGATALLVIEVADTSLKYDTTRKAPLYASHGVREYWVIDAKTLATKVHREPSSSGYASVLKVPPGKPLVPALASGLALRLADLNV